MNSFEQIPQSNTIADAVGLFRPPTREELERAGLLMQFEDVEIQIPLSGSTIEPNSPRAFRFGPEFRALLKKRIKHAHTNYLGLRTPPNERYANDYVKGNTILAEFAHAYIKPL